MTANVDTCADYACEFTGDNPEHHSHIGPGSITPALLSPHSELNCRCLTGGSEPSCGGSPASQA
jgi:hypothetical protein